MPLIIPFEPSVPDQRFSTTLDSDQLSFRALWNGIDKAWYMDVFTSGGEVILRATKIVLGINLGKRSTHPYLQRNLFHAFDTTNQGKEAGLDDLGGRVRVLRFSLTELLFGPQT